MKRDPNTRRSRRLLVRLTMDEYDRLNKKYRSTTYRTLSEYHRALLLQLPVSVHFRNQSLDEFLPIAIAIKDDLNACVKDFSEAVVKIGGLSANGGMGAEPGYYDLVQFSLLQKVEEIKSMLIKIYDHVYQNK